LPGRHDAKALSIRLSAEIPAEFGADLMDSDLNAEFFDSETPLTELAGAALSVDGLMQRDEERRDEAEEADEAERLGVEERTYAAALQAQAKARGTPKKEAKEACFAPI